MPWFVSMRIMAVRPNTVVSQYRISVIFKSDGAELRFTFDVLCAITSSIGENIKAPPSAKPPSADFFKKLRRGFSGWLWVSAIAGSGSFKPILDKSFCEGVMVLVLKFEKGNYYGVLKKLPITFFHKLIQFFTVHLALAFIFIQPAHKIFLDVFRPFGINLS